MKRILFSAMTIAVLGLAAGCGDEGPTDPPVVSLTSAVPVTQISGATYSEKVYSIGVPPGATRLTVGTSGGTGNVDLFVRKGQVPRGALSDCESFGLETTETCEFNAPAPAVYYIVLYAPTPYSNVTLTATITMPT